MDEICKHCILTGYGDYKVNTSQYNLCEGSCCEEAELNLMEENMTTIKAGKNKSIVNKEGNCILEWLYNEEFKRNKDSSSIVRLNYYDCGKAVGKILESSIRTVEDIIILNSILRKYGFEIETDHLEKVVEIENTIKMLEKLKADLFK